MSTTTGPTVAPGIYDLTDDHRAMREVVRQIAQERVAPRAAEIDERAEYPEDLRELFAEHDLFGLPFPAEYGGTGTDTVTLVMAIEEVAKACASTALMLAVQDLGSLPIRLFGTDEQKQRWLPKLASGEWTCAFALSEPDAGSDPGSMRTRAVRDGGEWVIDGEKNWTTNIGVADIYCVFCVTDPEASRSRGKAAAKVDRRERDLGKYSAMAKLFCGDNAMRVTVEAVQVLGGYGYVKEYPVERMMRDAKITQIYEGTQEIQRLVVARSTLA